LARTIRSRDGTSAVGQVVGQVPEERGVRGLLRLHAVCEPHARLPPPPQPAGEHLVAEQAPHLLAQGRRAGEHQPGHFVLDQAPVAGDVPDDDRQPTSIASSSEFGLHSDVEVLSTAGLAHGGVQGLEVLVVGHPGDDEQDVVALGVQLLYAVDGEQRVLDRPQARRQEQQLDVLAEAERAAQRIGRRRGAHALRDDPHLVRDLRPQCPAAPGEVVVERHQRRGPFDVLRRPRSARPVARTERTSRSRTNGRRSAGSSVAATG
jgi:hypothetical protein